MDTAGNLYVVDAGNNRVLTLAAGLAARRPCCRSPASTPPGVWRWMPPATSTSLTYGNNRVVELAAGSSTQSVLPFTGLNSPDGVAVDAAGDLYVADVGNNRVRGAGGGGEPPRACCRSPASRTPQFVAVDTAGNLYVTDWEQSGGETGGGFDHPGRVAVHRPPLPRRVWRWTPPATSTSPTRTIGW